MFDVSNTNNVYTSQDCSTNVSSGSNVDEFYYKLDDKVYSFSASGTNHQFDTSGYFLLGQEGATLKLPNFVGVGEKIKYVYLTSSQTCSTDVAVNIYTNETAASTSLEYKSNKWNSSNYDYCYSITKNLQSQQLFVKVMNSNDAQITKIKIITEVIRCEQPTFNYANGTIFSGSIHVTATTSTPNAKVVYKIWTKDNPSTSTYEDFPSEGLTVSQHTMIWAHTTDVTNTYADSYDTSVTYNTIENELGDRDGSFGNAYRVFDIFYSMKDCVNYQYPNDYVWVNGYVVGSVGEDGTLLDTDVDSNIALGSYRGDTDGFIPVELNGNLKNIASLKLNPDIKGKEIYVYGKIGDFLSTVGITNTSKIYVYNGIEIKTDEGYATFYTNCAFEMPSGMKGGIVESVGEASTDANNTTIRTLGINYKYSADDVVPANTALLVKGEVIATFPLTYTNSSAEAPSNNKLSGSVNDEETTGGDLYYMLSYESSAHQSLGFYWGSDNGAAFTNGAHKAYLALSSSEAGSAKGFSLEEETTGISQIENSDTDSEAVYTIDGRRIENCSSLKSGLYIVKGRKFVVK